MRPKARAWSEDRVWATLPTLLLLLISRRGGWLGYLLSVCLRRRIREVGEREIERERGGGSWAAFLVAGRTSFTNCQRFCFWQTKICARKTSLQLRTHSTLAQYRSIYNVSMYVYCIRIFWQCNIILSLPNATHIRIYTERKK